ncbi:hypothetical protein AHF37_09690 [Paragonimus kellicotti]|nr:hypothetical protein AHF37_09690 [Paragonimus kellicotti]
MHSKSDPPVHRVADLTGNLSKSRQFHHPYFWSPFTNLYCPLPRVFWMAGSATVLCGIVKQVLSGDSIVIRDRPVDGPPPERTIVLSNIVCGKLARRPTINIPNGVVDDPFAWQAREFVRSKLIGKEVCYTVETELPSGRTYGCVYLGKSANGENIARSLLEEGLAELRKLNAPAADKNATYQQLLAAEESARSLGKGRWSPNQSSAVRDVVWSISDPKSFVDKRKRQQTRGIVEYVRDGSSMQLTLLPDVPGSNTFYNIMLSLSGVRAPVIRMEDGKQRTSSKWEYCRVSVPGAADAYRAAERLAKERRLRLWKDYQTPSVPVETSLVHDPNKISPGMSFSGNVS